MPLHLLHKKSWNVYSPANIERVKRDEAKARRHATEQEQRSLQQEADDRLSTLQQSRGQSKSLKYKLPGEDDTDRDIRLALENTPAVTNTGKPDHGSLVDANGNIALIPAPEKRSRVDQEQAKDPYTVYLSDALGERHRSKDTWYTSIRPEREKWGNDNPRKQERELTRLNANDPLAAMKRGVQALRENERQRQEWMRERERDLGEVEVMERSSERNDRKRRRSADRDEDDSESLEGFNLDDAYTKSEGTEHQRDRKGEHRRRHHHTHDHHHHRRHRRHRDLQAVDENEYRHERQRRRRGDDTDRATGKETEAS